MAETVGVHEHLIAAALAAALQVALVRAGDEGLHAADLLQQAGAAGHVQLGHHVVQQQNRRLAGLPAEDLQLGQLHAQGGGADLPLGREHLHLPALEGQQDVLTVNTAHAALITVKFESVVEADGHIVQVLCEFLQIHNSGNK